MNVLLDTNILTRTALPGTAACALVDDATNALLRRGDVPCLVPQVLYELWVVATRPTSANGLGFTPNQAAAEVARVDSNRNGVIDFVEADFEGTSDGNQPNSRLFIPATQFKRFAVTREINDGLLAPRLAPSQRAWVLSGTLTPVSPSVPASTGRDGDDR